MANKERGDRMARLVFNRHNLSQLRGAINKLLDIFHDILEKDFQYGSYFKADEILARLDAVEQDDWRDIRSRYIQEEYHGYCNKNFSDEEMRNPSKILLDFVSALDVLRKGVHEKMDQKHVNLMEYEKKLNDFRDSQDAIQNQLMREKDRMTGRVKETAGMEGKLAHLEKTLQEKMEKISELQRESNVQLWEKEKERILKNSKNRIDELENELKNLREKYKDAMSRMSTIGDKAKITKLKNEMSSDKGGASSEEMNVLKRECYVKEKDISHLESEMSGQQKMFVGILGGVRIDVNKFSEQFYDDETSTRDPEFLKLTRTLDRLYTSAAQGNLQTMKGVLPPHYFHYETDVKLKKVRRLSKVGSMPFILPGIGQNPDSGDVADGGKAKGTNGVTMSNPYLARKRPGVVTEMPPVSENPVLVDPITDKMNGNVYLKHFPHMAQNFILDHWQKFKEYDNNGDRTLDLTEVIKMLTGLGCDFTAEQVAEAMEEVDVDHSHTLDFYEYLLVVDKCVKKTGQAKLFKAGLSGKNNVVVSKSCVVQ